MEQLKAIRERLAVEQADVFLVSNPVNRRYLTGFTGSTGILWITPNSQAVLSDSRYLEQVIMQCPGWEAILTENMLATMGTLIKKQDVRKIIFEKDHATVNQWEEWKRLLPAAFHGTSGWIQDLRMIKTHGELASIRQAAKLADQAFSEVLPRIRAGISERDLALSLELCMRQAGASGVSFSPIVASGPCSAMPHAKPTDRVLRDGDLVIVDFGCIVNGYCSDMTRTVVIGKPKKRHLWIYDLVHEAQRAALAAISPGRTCNEIDAIARSIITEAGYGKYFGHPLGHGVGLEIHENPRLSTTDYTVLKPGMVVTVEPGVYLPGFGGVRIEDLVVVTAEGHETLSTTSRDLNVR